MSYPSKNSFLLSKLTIGIDDEWVIHHSSSFNSSRSLFFPDLRASFFRRIFPPLHRFAIATATGLRIDRASVFIGSLGGTRTHKPLRAVDFLQNTYFHKPSLSRFVPLE